MSIRSSMLRRRCSPSFQPGQTTIWPFISMQASPKARIYSRLLSASLLPSSVRRSCGSVACTETLMGLMRRSMMRCASRSVRFVSVM